MLTRGSKQEGEWNFLPFLFPSFRVTLTTFLFREGSCARRISVPVTAGAPEDYPCADVDLGPEDPRQGAWRLPF